MVRPVARDLLPLPYAACSDSRYLTGQRPRSSLERKCAQRITKALAIGSRVEECIWSVNTLYDAGEWDGVRLSEAQVTTLQFIEDAVKSDVPPCGMEGPEESFTQILGKRASSYAEDDGSMRVAPLKPDSEISWPERAGSAVLADCLPASLSADVLGVRERLMLPAEELADVLKSEGKASVYWDPTLRDDDVVYSSFVRELIDRRMVSLQTQQPLQSVGCFFVLKQMEL